MYKEIVNDYLESSSILRKGTTFSREPLNEKWITFNQDLANSLSHIYNYSTLFFDKIKNEYPEIDTRYYSFYFDFIVSKPSNTIFTETPKDSIKDPFALTANSIAGEMYKLFEVKNNINILNKRLQIFFHRTFLYYDFIFYNNEGMFTKSIFNKELFLLQKKAISSILETTDSSREVFTKAIIINIKNTLHLKKYQNNMRLKNFFIKSNSEIFSSKLSDYNYNDIFKEYIQYQKNNTKPFHLVEVEVFTYILANKIWKFDKIYQNRLEEFDYTDKIDTNFIVNMKNYIATYLNYINDYYTGDLIKGDLFNKIAAHDKNFITKIYDEYLPKVKDSNPKIIDITCNQKYDYKVTSDISSSELIYKYAINKKAHQKVKFYRVLENAKSDDISLLLNNFYTFINENENIDLQNKETYFMGILRSGSFLSHALNVMRKDNHKNITAISYSLLTHPFISIMPRELYAKRENPTTIYIDESIKSAYSVNIAHNFRKNFLSRFNLKPHKPEYLFTLVNFIDYKSKVIGFKDDIKWYSFSNLKIQYANKEDIKYHLIANNTKDNLDQKMIFNWKEFLTSLKVNNLNQILDYGTIEAIKNNKKLDLTKIISNSYLLFYIGKQFADDLNTYLKDEDKDINLIFYPGSLEGKLLIDITTFVYKILYDKESQRKYHFTGKNISAEDFTNIKKYKKIFFDISIVSGKTVEKCVSLDLHDKSNTFDKHFIVAQHCDNKTNNVTSIFKYPKK